MKISETVKGLYDDLQNQDGKEIVSITFCGLTWKLEISSFIKIFEYATKYIESKK